MGKSLSPATVEQYHRDGYFFPIRALTTMEARQYRDKLEALAAHPNHDLRRAARAKCHLLLTWADEIVRKPRILDIIEDLIGPDILCWSTQLFIKRPMTANYVSWHQDSPYWGLDEPRVVTAWIALSESTPENGNLQVIPGTHVRELAHRDSFAKDNMLSRGQAVVEPIAEAAAVDLRLRAGELSLHNPLIVHGSGPNRSSISRIGLVARYTPPSVRQLVGPRGWASLMRGEDRYGHFRLLPRPERDFDPAMVVLHERIQAEISARKTSILADSERAAT